MHRTTTLILLLMTTVGCVVSPGEPPSAPASSSLEIADLEADFGTIVPPLLEKYNVPGASVAVLVDREIVLRQR